MKRAILSLLWLGAATAATAADPPDARRFTLKDGMPEVVWYDSTTSWPLAAGYPRLLSGRSFEASAPDPVTKRRTASLPAGDSMVLRFVKPPPFAGGPDPETAVQVTISATQATVRSTYRKEQYDFAVAMTPPPESVAPDEPFEFGARGTVTRSVPNPSYDAEAGLGLSIFETLSDNPDLRGFGLGDVNTALGWLDKGEALQKGTTGRQTQLDWASVDYAFNAGIGLNVSLAYGYTREARPAVVFLPGVAGSVLESLNALGSFEVWPTAKASSRTTLALEPDGRTPAIKDSMIRVRGVLRSAPANFYGGIIDFLAGKGWKEDEDLFVFPYDWRLDNRSHFEALDQVIRKAGRIDDPAKQRKVVLIAHSMGGVISRAYLLSSAERRKNVKAFISIATPYLGAPKVFYGFANGYGFGNPTVRSELMKVLIQNLPAAYQLVPWEPFVTEGNRTLSLEETYGIRYRGYSQSLAGYVWDTYVPTEDTPWLMNPGLVAAARGFREPQGGKRNPQALGGVQHYVIIGTGVKTLSAYRLADSKEAQPGLRLGSRGIALAPVFLDGDGTVPLWSLEIAGATRTYYVPYVSQFGSDISSGHADLPGNPRVLDIVGRILSGKAPDSNEFRRTTELIEVESLDVSLHSNATLSIEGKGGRLGLNAGGAIEESLPTGTMLVTESGEYASIAALDRPYTAIVSGTGTGEFTLDVSITRRGGGVAYRYPKVAVEAGSNARVPIDPRSNQTPAPLSVTTAGRTTQVFPTMLDAPVAAVPPAPVPPPTVIAQEPEPLRPPAPPPAGERDRVQPASTGGIAVRSATYGRNCKAAEGNVTAHAQKACDGKGQCDYRIDYTQIGDPAYGCQKDYFVDWSCGGAQTFTLRAAPEAGFGSVLKLSCPPPAGAVSGMAPPPSPSSPPASTGPAVTLDKCPYGFEEYRGKNTQLVCTCSGPDAAYDGRLYGADEYTDDSYICKAAVHSGAMDPAGGTVRVVPVPGRSSYPAVTRNGVRSGSWGAWPGAYRVERAAAAPARAPGRTVVLAACPYGFEEYRGKDTIVVCPCSGTDAAYDGRLYGVDEYTDDSYICKAAVHAGAIGAGGGTIRVIPMPGRASYAAVERNGVRSGSWGAWSGSYRIERGP